MPRPVEPGQHYVPGLDGIRALAVLSVIAYHVNAPWAKGGMLGVGVFFTLSGYLITDLLLDRWRRRGDLGLGTFWLRRARRLLPALFLMLAAVSVWVAIFDSSQLAAVRKQVIAAALYFSNWSTIAEHGSYFTRFANPLPLDHLWSLAIEEQFYLLWPFLLLVAIWRLGSRALIVAAMLAGAALSALTMGHLYHPGYDPSRVYEGTDTRAFELLIGAALAAVWPTLQRRARGRSVPVGLLDLLGVAGLICVLVLVWRTSSFAPFLYPAGFLLLSVATTAMLAAVVSPWSRLGAILSFAPLRWIGVRSYGIYLWQWPIIVLASPTQTRFHLGRATLEVAATLIIAALSWRYVEEPIRNGALPRRWHGLRAGAAQLDVRRRSLTALGGTLAALGISVLSLAGILPAASAGTRSSNPELRAVPKLAAATGPRRAAVTGTIPTRTSCRSVIYLGDSTSEGQTGNDYLPDPGRRLPAQLAKVGVSTTISEISGARSIVETFQGQPNAATVAKQHIASGFNGCWIIAMGTNDVDNFHDGGPGFAYRINRMMSAIGRQPSLWVDVVTLLRTGPYAESAMQRWNRALLQACGHFPNMRVFDWSYWAKRRWFIPDGIHYYSSGYAARNARIAHGLAHAFPDGSAPSASCVVR